MSVELLKEIVRLNLILEKNLKQLQKVAELLQPIIEANQNSQPTSEEAGKLVE